MVLIAIHSSQPFFTHSEHQCLLIYWFSISASGTAASRMQTFQNRHGTLELWNPYCCLVEKPGCLIHPKHKLMYTWIAQILEHINRYWCSTLFYHWNGVWISTIFFRVEVAPSVTPTSPLWNSSCCFPQMWTGRGILTFSNHWLIDGFNHKTIGDTSRHFWRCLTCNFYDSVTRELQPPRFETSAGRWQELSALAQAMCKEVGRNEDATKNINTHEIVRRQLGNRLIRHKLRNFFEPRSRWPQSAGRHRLLWGPLWHSALAHLPCFH